MKVNIDSTHSATISFYLVGEHFTLEFYYSLTIVRSWTTIILNTVNMKVICLVYFQFYFCLDNSAAFIYVFGIFYCTIVLFI